MLTVTFPCGHVRWTLVTAFAFLISRSAAGVRVRSLLPYLSQRHKRMEIARQEKYSLGVFITVFLWTHCILLLERFLNDFHWGHRKTFFCMHPNCVNKQQKHSLIKLLSRTSLLSKKVKAWNVISWALASLAEARSFDPENKISTPPVKALTLSLADVTVSSRGVTSSCVQWGLQRNKQSQWWSSEEMKILKW